MATCPDENGIVYKLIHLTTVSMVLLLFVLPFIVLCAINLLSDEFGAALSDKVVDSMVGSPKQLAARPTAREQRMMRRHLEAISSFEGEARGASSYLRIVVLDHNGDAEMPLENGAGANADLKMTGPKGPGPENGYRPITLNTAAADDTAVLVIASQPITWNVVPGAKTRRGVLAFEGGAPLFVNGGYPGLLAGYRISAFGNRNATRAGDFLAGTDRARFCSAIKVWRKYFDVPASNVWMSTIRNATDIRITNVAIHHDGVRVPFIPSLSLFCGTW